ncbi:hypothetical protein WMY93_007524 [Mugilogobius chulae]|uniref:Uncharacterized protein n=1 Tax=Mugilogobius chulae TaxID=88201 RepID=A0AAW0PRW0_9GOBI
MATGPHSLLGHIPPGGSERGLNPVACPIQGVLEFLQDLLEKGRVTSPYQWFASAIVMGHKGFTVYTARTHPLVVLDGLLAPLLEPLERVKMDCLSIKTDSPSPLCALLVHPACLSLGAEGRLVGAVAKPSLFAEGQGLSESGLSFHPHIFRSWMLGRHLLCPVKDLRCYVERKASFRRKDQLFVAPVCLFFPVLKRLRPCRAVVS